MTDLQQKYSESPQHNSPATLDAKILARAAHQATEYKHKKRSGWLPGWPPVAASAAVACLCLFLVFRPNFEDSAAYAPNTGNSELPAPLSSAQLKTESDDIIVANTIQQDTNAVAGSAALSSLAENSVAAADSLIAVEPGTEPLGVTEPLVVAKSPSTDDKARERRQRLEEQKRVPDRQTTVLAEKIKELEETAIEMEVATVEAIQMAPESVPVPTASPAASESVAASVARDVGTDSESARLSVAQAEPPSPSVDGLGPQLRLSALDDIDRSRTKPTSAVAAPKSSARVAKSVASTALADNPEPDLARPGIRSATSNWLDSLPENSFVLQLSIGRDRAAMAEELRIAGFDLADIHFLPVILREDPGYAALYGAYTSDTEAYNRANEIKQQGRLEPWVRERSDIINSR